MRLARVVGHVVSTVQDARLAGWKLLVVQPVDDRARPVDRTLLAVDAAQAGVGDYVLVVQEGKSARAEMGVPDAPCEAIIVGIVDYVQVAGAQHRLTPPEPNRGLQPAGPSRRAAPASGPQAEACGSDGAMATTDATLGPPDTPGKRR